MNQKIALNLNTVALLLLCIILSIAFYLQFMLRELPCPLCLLQRLAITFMMIGLVLNIKQAVRSSHYGIILLSSLFGMVVSMRQILLHIVPGTGSYGSAIFGLHDYTWAFAFFFLSIASLGFMLLSEKQYQDLRYEYKKPLNFIHHFIIGFAIFLVAMNSIASLLECGIGQCVDNPTAYILIK